MKTDFLHKLTGRLVDFKNPLLNLGSASAHLGNDLVRQWLGLTDTTTDCHVIATLLAASAYPEDSKISGFHLMPDDIDRESPLLTGGTFATAPGTPPVLAYCPVVFPFPVDFTLIATEDGLLIRHAYGAETVRASAGESESGVSLCVSWPAWMGVAGNITLQSAWAPGAELLLHLPPASYPFTALKAEASKQALIVRTLDAAGLGKAWKAEPNPVRAAAVLARALTV